MSYTFLINSKGIFYVPHPTNRTVHTMAFVMPVVEHWLEQEIAQCQSWSTGWNEK